MWNMNDVKKIQYKHKYVYHIVFDDGKSGDVDLSEYIIKGPVFEPLRENGIECEQVQLAGHEVQGCKACYKCSSKKNKRCSFEGDIVNECIGKMIEADGIILGSPVYVTDVTSEMKALIDRAGFVAGSNGRLFARKIGAGVVVVVIIVLLLVALSQINHSK